MSPSATFPSTAITLYADLVQKVEAVERTPGAVYRNKGRGGPYLYAVEKHGSVRVQRYLGPEANEDARAEAALVEREAAFARLRRNQVSMIKRAGLPGPSLEVGRLLEAVARSGMFDSGLVLVGTIAFSLYPAMLGHRLAGSLAMTQDADFAVASVADTRGDADLTTVLRRADPSFEPALVLDRKSLPKKFRSATGFEVEVLTPVRTRADDGTVQVKALGAGATPLHYLEFLIHDAIKVVALYNDGVPVTVPQPARYAVHKLIIAQERKINAAKREKDLRQAEALLAVLRSADPFAFDDALDDARSRGGKWRANIERSLAMIEQPPVG